MLSLHKWPLKQKVLEQVLLVSGSIVITIENLFGIKN